MSVKRVQAIVTGNVHGVGFRYYAVHVAGRLGVTGTVRNTADGVEAVAEGDEASLKDFVDQLRQGPSNAEVRDVLEAWSDVPAGSFASFTAIS